MVHTTILLGDLKCVLHWWLRSTHEAAWTSMMACKAPLRRALDRILRLQPQDILLPAPHRLHSGKCCSKTLELGSRERAQGPEHDRCAIMKGPAGVQASLPLHPCAITTPSVARHRAPCCYTTGADTREDGSERLQTPVANT